MKRDAVWSELHPEELLAKASRGALAPREDADLRAHLARCPACALQVDLRGEIDGALAPTALDYEIGARAVERLFASRELDPARAPARERGPRRIPRLVTRVALGLALLLGTSVAASALVLGTRGRLWDVADRREPGDPVGPARRASHARPEYSEAKPLADAPATPAPAKPAPAVAPLAPAPPAVAPVAVPQVTRRVVARRELFAIDDVSDHDKGAAALFGAAESARGQGDFAEARRLYAQLASRFHGTREELSARVLGGQMMLDDLDEPAAALRSFERYLRDEANGTLAEEALLGRAQALRRLGRANTEAAAWSDLLARYPRSVHAELARERLAALAAP